MRQPAAREGDRVVAMDVHVVMVPAPPGSPVPTPLPHRFDGELNGNLSSDVRILGRPAVTVGSTADNRPPHHPESPGNAFQNPPSNKATITDGSPTVRINGKAAARLGDAAATCSDGPCVQPGKVATAAAGTVKIG